MLKSQNTNEAVQIAPNIYWVGMHLPNDPFQCHSYLIKNGNESIIVDPGSMLEFDETVRKIKSIIDIRSVKYIILHHQDPDLAAAVPDIEKLIDREDLLIVTHSRMSLLIKHYQVKSKYYEIDKNNNELKTNAGITLKFYTTPYCHSPGAIVTYEPTTKTLFSGDIFGGIDNSWEFYADETYFEKAKQFHQEYMPSKDIFNYALNKIEKLDIDLIAPQHGSIIEKRYIDNLINDMKNLDCGLYIENRYNRELMDTIKELQEKEEILKERDLLLLEQSKRAEIGEMIGNIAHQWRQPLAIINTSVAILKEKNSANLLTKEEIAQKLERMEKRIIYMSDTINDFMNYYKPDRGASFFLVSEAVKNALEIVGFTSKDTKVKIELSLDEDYKVHGLINEFIQVIVSILSNINDLITDRNLENVIISIKGSDGNTYKALSITDNCGGVDEKNLPKIFDPYFTTKHKSIGAGLGLYIAKMIVEDKMNGTLSVKNSGNGAEFTIKMKK